MVNNTILNQTHVTKENGTETIKVYNQQKNVYFEITINTTTKEVMHYLSKPISDVVVTDLIQ